MKEKGMMWINKIICKLCGHKWIWEPINLHPANYEIVFTCLRCGKVEKYNRAESLAKHFSELKKGGYLKMQREIKFRAWDFEEKSFWYFTMQDILHRWNPREVLPEPTNNPDVQQYTGLKDKNGKEIYEGDVVELEGDSEFRGKVWYDDRKAMFCEADLSLAEIATLSIEVIGNIYENPELLEGEDVPKQ